MFQPDEVIQSILMHRTDEPYNPAKRREYYLKTRQLKGRSTGTKEAPSKDSSVIRGPSKIPPKKATPKKPSTAEMEKSVEALKEKLAALRKVLAELVAQAKARSGVGTPSDTSQPSKPGGSTKPTSPEKTEQQKAEDAKKAAEYYEANKDKILSDQVKELGDKLKTVAAKIRELREKLASPVKKTPQTTNRPVGVGQPINRKEKGQNGS